MITHSFSMALWQSVQLRKIVLSVCFDCLIVPSGGGGDRDQCCVNSFMCIKHPKTSDLVSLLGSYNPSKLTTLFFYNNV